MTDHILKNDARMREFSAARAVEIDAESGAGTLGDAATKGPSKPGSSGCRCWMRPESGQATDGARVASMRFGLPRTDL